MSSMSIVVSFCALTIILGPVESRRRVFRRPAREALCVMQPDPNSSQQVEGVIKLSQKNRFADVTITTDLTFINGTSTCINHGIHVHTFGDIKDGCESTGSHYNPYKSHHGAPTASRRNRHVGDLGNVRRSDDGTIKVTFTDHLITLFGRRTIIGRAIVLHENEDDLGRGGNSESLSTGNAGSGISCCVIGWAK